MYSYWLKSEKTKTSVECWQGVPGILFDRAGGGGQDWHEICMLPGEVVRRGIFLGKARKV